MASKIVSAEAAAARIPDGAVVTVSSSSGLGCPDKVLAAIGARFDAEGHPRNLTTLHPIAAGDMYGIKGVDHIAKDGLLSTIIAGSYPSGPSSLPMPEIWRMLTEDRVAAYNVPSGILFDMHRDVAARRPGVLTQVGLDTFADPIREGCAMNAAAAAKPIVKRVEFGGETWLHFPNIVPNVAIIRATTADERGNLTYEHEGAYLGGLDQAIAVRNHGGLVIAQVKRVTAAGSLRPHDVRVPGHLVDLVVVDPDQLQTTETPYDPAISGEIMRPWSSFNLAEHGVEKIVARRAAMELQDGHDREPRLRDLLDGAADPAGGRLPAGGDLGDRAGRRRGHAADGVRLRLRLERRRLHAVAEPVHLLPGRRVRRDLPVVPGGRPRGQRQRLEARQEALSDGRLRRLRRHHGERQEDRLRGAVRGRRTARARRGRDPGREARQVPEDGREGRACDLLRPAGAGARAGGALRHRALRDPADRQGPGRDRGDAGHRPAARHRRRLARPGEPRAGREVLPASLLGTGPMGLVLERLQPATEWRRRPRRRRRPGNRSGPRRERAASDRRGRSRRAAARQSGEAQFADRADARGARRPLRDAREGSRGAGGDRHRHRREGLLHRGRHRRLGADGAVRLRPALGARGTPDLRPAGAARQADDRGAERATPSAAGWSWRPPATSG